MTIFQRVDSRSGGRHFKKCYKGFVYQIERINNYSKKKFFQTSWVRTV